MNRIKYLLAMPLLMLASCAQEDLSEVENDTVTVNFSAKIPQSVGTRAVAAPVDQVVCAVYDETGTIEYPALRRSINISEEDAIEYAPQLIKGQKYNVVFWASNAGKYDVGDMTVITRSTTTATTDETKFDAFTACETIEVGNNTSAPKVVTLNRPLAKLNVAVNEADWNAVKDLGFTPKTIKITLSAPTKFNACSGTASDEQLTEYVIPITNLTFNKDGVTYHQLAECFIMLDAHEKKLKDVTIGIYADEQCGTPIRENISMPNLPLQNNYITNLLGGLMTVTVTYSIEFQNEFEDDKPANIQ